MRGRSPLFAICYLLFSPMLTRILQFIRFSHTIFALPFAVWSMLVAAKGLPSVTTVGLILLAMVFALTAAIAFNRIAVWETDKLNPLTVSLHLLVSLATA